MCMFSTVPLSTAQTNSMCFSHTSNTILAAKFIQLNCTMGEWSLFCVFMWVSMKERERERGPTGTWDQDEQYLCYGFVMAVIFLCCSERNMSVNNSTTVYEAQWKGNQSKHGCLLTFTLYNIQYIYIIIKDFFHPPNCHIHNVCVYGSVLGLGVGQGLLHPGFIAFIYLFIAFCLVEDNLEGTLLCFIVEGPSREHFIIF